MDIIKLNSLSLEEIAHMREEVAGAVLALDAYHSPPKNAVYLYPNANLLRGLHQQVKARGSKWLHPAILPSPLAFGLWLVFGATFGKREQTHFTAHHEQRMQIMGHIVAVADFLTGKSLSRGMVYFALLDVEAKKRGFRVLQVRPTREGRAGD